jgi:hypothetical protein
MSCFGKLSKVFLVLEDGCKGCLLELKLVAFFVFKTRAVLAFADLTA